MRTPFHGDPSLTIAVLVPWERRRDPPCRDIDAVWNAFCTLGPIAPVSSTASLRSSDAGTLPLARQSRGAIAPLRSSRLVSERRYRPRDARGRVSSLRSRRRPSATDRDDLGVPDAPRRARLAHALRGAGVRAW